MSPAKGEHCNYSNFSRGSGERNPLQDALVVAALFFPTIFIFYNSSAWIYVVAYAVISLVGNLVGWPFYKKK